MDFFHFKWNLFKLQNLYSCRFKTLNSKVYYKKIIFPSVSVMLITFILLYTLSLWNDFLTALRGGLCRQQNYCFRPQDQFVIYCHHINIMCCTLILLMVQKITTEMSSLKNMMKIKSIENFKEKRFLITCDLML